ncbi:MAG: bifunctional demethylmenaquinone methyltransferase/2-methoxy-6-polyprenyl-1,4-benzoquinol methylase UbiE [Rhodobacteraceae bacterium]|nr:bifunctional demethylmenaquinone methyltransferase/2-methoxy-6-polyprenyl-1,4-benzoquinol methylase UbiE [Paracoccaceae bacterium]
MRSTEQDTHFGFRTIPKGEKADRVRDVFIGVSSRYDLMNDLMSGGMHRIWKNALVDWLMPQQDQRILDLAGGTGDIALRIVERQPNASLTVLDLTEEMLAMGRDRAARLRSSGDIAWITGSADALPFAADSFDACTVAFGIRNFPDIPESLAEMHRVLRPGGRLLILEFGHVEVSGLRRLYDRYSFSVLPRLGNLVLNDRESYQYLVESIRRFPRRKEFAGMIEAAGFVNVAVRNMSFGVASIHSAWKI